MINPLIPTEMMIDLSVIVDAFGRPDAFADFSVVPPNTGICRPGEYLSQVVFVRADGTARGPTPTRRSAPTPTPPMVNGLGVLGWGVGGIEAEAAMLSQPTSMLIPQVLGLRSPRPDPAADRPPRGGCRVVGSAPGRGGIVPG